MTTRSMSVNDLQLQIEELIEVIEQQSQRTREQTEQIAALQAATANAAFRAPNPEIAPTRETPSFPKIPDLIRLVPEFKGDPRNLPRWIESVEEKLDESKRFVPENEISRIMPVWIGIIRDKITGKANDALSASHVPLEWDSIKITLTEYFGDKSDLSTLVSKLTSLQQGSQSVTEFFQTCRSLLAEINAKIMINNTPNEAKAIMGTYETLMINAFVDGLHDATSDLTRSTRPQSLAAAYQVASEHEAAKQRRQEKNSKHPPDVMKTKPPPNTNGPQFSRPSNFAPYFQNKPFVPAQMTYQRPFQRFAPPGFNQANQPNINFNNRPQLQAPPNIKPDPSGQNRQNNFKQMAPYRRSTQINVHETPEESYSDYPEYTSYSDQDVEQYYNQAAATPETEEQQEELNFCMVTDQTVAE